MRQHRHVGVYALTIDADHLLLIKKGRGPYTGMLDMPGGRIGFGETPEQTLIREVFEETRLHVTSHRILCRTTTPSTPTGCQMSRPKPKELRPLRGRIRGGAVPPGVSLRSTPGYWLSSLRDGKGRAKLDLAREQKVHRSDSFLSV